MPEETPKPKIPEYFFRDGKKKKSMKQEDRLAKKLGGIRQKASGAIAGSRGDVRIPELLIEAKRTDKKSISIKVDYLENITNEAMAYGLIPAVSIELLNTPPLVAKDWVMVPAEFLRELLDMYRDSEDD